VQPGDALLETMTSPTPESAARPETVALWRGATSYPTEPPFHPGDRYPELADLGAATAAGQNPAFEGVRGALHLLGFDAARFGTPAWNPLGTLVAPGDRVLVKPNWVMHRHPDEERLGLLPAFECLVTHTAVLRAVVDYVQIALRGEGRIVIADAPLQGCDFAALNERARIPELLDHYRRLADAPAAGSFRPLPVSVVDLRLETAVERSTLGGFGITMIKDRRNDESRHTIVSLDGYSALEPISVDSKAFRVTCYDPVGMTRAHGPGLHAYCIGSDVLEADAVINVPKLKTHKKAGVTVALKNLVGINGHKSYLPHHRRGSIAQGGDEFLAADLLKDLTSRLHDVQFRDGQLAWRQRLAAAAGSAFMALDRLVREDGTETGSWYGNDTIWRTCLDLNRILLYADPRGVFQGAALDARPQRRVLHVVDGIHGGDGDGPLAPDPRPSGVILAGSSAPYVDLAAVLVMGLAWREIPLVREAFGAFRGAPLVRGLPADLRIESNVAQWRHAPLEACLLGLPDALGYRPAPGWEGVLDPAGPVADRAPVHVARRRLGVLWRRQAARALPG
jgi:uncharacterized protein (DUF362 family)